MSAKSGLTLVELIVAFALFTVGSTTMIHMMSVGMFASTNLKQSIVAMHLVNGRMEEIKNTAFGSISSGTETGSSIGYDVFDNREVTVTNTETDLKDVEVEMQWTQKGGQQTLAISTYIADY